jgi:hypothetical protein
MSTLVKRRRGSTAEHALFTGEKGEITVDTDNSTAVVHDGQTPGGHPLAKVADLETHNGAAASHSATGMVSRWSEEVNYTLPALTIGSNGLTYACKQASGPGTDAGVQDPILPDSKDYWGAPQVPAPDAGAIFDVANVEFVKDWTRKPLTADTTVYLSATGDDANDGKTLATAKGTAAGINALLAGIDPRGYIIAIKVSGIITGDWAIGERSFRLNISGVTEDSANGFTGRIANNAAGGTCSIGNICASDLAVGRYATSNLYGQITLAGTANKIFVDSLGFVGGNPHINISGSFPYFVLGTGRVMLEGMKITQDGSISYNYFAGIHADGFASFIDTDISELTTPPTYNTYQLLSGGKAYSNTTLPGNNSVAVYNPSISDNAIGTGQAWQDMTANRAFGTTYTNTTGKPIEVSIDVQNGGTDSSIGLWVGSAIASSRYVGTTAGKGGNFSAIVPPGQTYVFAVNSGDSTTLRRWSELR